MEGPEIKEKYTPRLRTLYKETIIPQLQEKFKYKNVLAVPRLRKVVVNMGVSGATSDAKLVEKASADLALITG